MKFKSLLCSVVFMSCICAWVSCINRTSTQTVKPSSQNTVFADSVSSISFHVLKHEKFIALDTVDFPIPKNVSLSSKNIFDGIYEISSNELIKKRAVIHHSFAFITTYENLGMGFSGYLYVFGRRNKTLVFDSEFKHNYLYSAGGIFIINQDGSKIFSVGKPEWYYAKGEEIIPASIVTIKNDHFVYLKNVYIAANEIPSINGLKFFFSKALAEDSTIHTLPGDWWKVR